MSITHEGSSEDSVVIRSLWLCVYGDLMRLKIVLDAGTNDIL